MAFCLSLLPKACHGCINLPRLRGRLAESAIAPYFPFSFLPRAIPRTSLKKMERRGSIERAIKIQNALHFLLPLSNLSEWNYPEGRRISKKTFFFELEGSLKFPTTPITSPGNKNYCCEKKKGEREREGKEGKARDWKLTKFLNESDRSMPVERKIEETLVNGHYPSRRKFRRHGSATR